MSKPAYPRPDISTLMHPDAFRPLKLAYVRSGKIKHVFNLPLESAIHKKPIHGPVQITPLGIPGDEHAFHKHGGVDKALLHYNSRHYDAWKEELPGSAHLFTVGGFGENLVSEGIDETTVCIGDKIAIGEIVVQVSEPRAPCMKLNHRFEVKNMAYRTQMTFRTGWLYRILQPGLIQAGDTITLLERPHPDWTVAKVQYYLYHEKDNNTMMQEAIDLPPLGVEIKKLFKARLDKGCEDQDQRLFGGDDKWAMKKWSEYRVVKKVRETKTVTSFVLEAIDPDVEETLAQPGSHVRVKLGGKLVRAYSVVGGTSKKFELGVALDAQSRGGSKFLHENTHLGDVLTVSCITTSFPLARDADRHIIVAGGIGITAFIAALQYLQDSDQHYELHFAVSDEVPFQRYLDVLGTKAIIYNKAQGKRLDLSAIISRADDNTHVYCCGPQRLMDGVQEAATKFSVPETHIHFETFAVATSGDPFTAQLKESNKVLEVSANQTLLEALKEAGMEIESSCEAGNCGTCRVDVCSGRVDHRGTALMENEKGTAMLSCVSRGVGRIVLDL